MLILTRTFEMPVTDELTGEKITFLVERPSAKLRNQYNNKAFQRRGSKTKFFTSLARVEFGLKVLKGIKDDEMSIPAEEHDNLENLRDDIINAPGGVPYLPISSNPTSKFFTKNWRQMVEKYADHLIEGIATKLFDNPVTVDDLETETDNYEDDGEDVEKN